MLMALFLVFMKIGALGFGGAYAAIPLVEKEIVEIHQWMTTAEFSNLLAIDEITPGPIFVNTSTFVGMNLGGVPGAILSTVGCIIPSFIISIALILLYRKYKNLTVLQNIIHTLKCMTIALIGSTFIKMTLIALFGSQGLDFSRFNLFGFPLIIISFYLINRKKINPLYAMLGCGALNLIYSMITGVL